VVCRPQQRPHWPELAQFQGTLGQGPERLKDLFIALFTLERALSKLHTYAHMRHDEDLASDPYKAANAKISFIYQDFGQEMAWIEPEILSLDEQLLASYLKAPVMAPYRIYLERIVRFKPHILPADQEELLALAGSALSTPGRAFSALNNADLKFPDVVDSKGESHPLSHGNYQLYIRSPDRTLRQNAFKTLHGAFTHHENSIAELLNGLVQCHLLNVRARKFPSCLEAALFPHQIDPAVYSTLVETVRRNISSLHRYMKVRKKLLGVDELHMYDVYVPLVRDVDLTYNYQEAEQMVCASVAPLGSEYQQQLKNGLLQERWVDRYENKRKRSGAYSGGCYDSMPYILMNYHGTLRDLMTLAHEAGHSMHSLLANKRQPYHYSGYSIFVAEVASTFNEELLFRFILEQEKRPEVRRFLINEKIEDIRATFFRQTMFAEFELKMHTLAEQNVPLTPTLLKSEYRALNEAYFGPDIVVDAEIDIEWARIPHFYNNFYVYQYATGISAAYAFFEKVMKGGGADRDAYLNMLASGSSDFPLDLLAKAGVDMRTPKPVESMIRIFDELVEQLNLSH